MSDILKILKQHPQWPQAQHIARQLQHHNFKAYIVGGAIRDALIQSSKITSQSRRPTTKEVSTSDIDMASNAMPDDVEKIFPHAIGIGRAFGIMSIPNTPQVNASHKPSLAPTQRRPLATPPRRWGRADQQESQAKPARGRANQQESHAQACELATLRSDGPYPDGRHPEFIRPGCIEHDAARRDFTINALYFDMQSHQLIDLHQGQLDLQNKIIRTVGTPAQRFQEDHLRCLRSLRFALQLNFQIENSTWKALQHHTKQHPTRPTSLSRERVKKEFLYMLKSPERALQLLQDTQLLNWVLPNGLPTRQSTSKAIRQLDEVLGLSRKEKSFMHWLLDGINQVLCYVGRPLPKVQARSISKSVILQHIAEALQRSTIPPALTPQKLQQFDLLKHLAHPQSHLLLKFLPVYQKLYAGPCKESLPEADQLKPAELLTVDNLQALWTLHTRLKKHDTRPKVKGQDLLDLGLKPGPTIAQWLHYAHSLQFLYVTYTV